MSSAALRVATVPWQPSYRHVVGHLEGDEAAVVIETPDGPAVLLAQSSPQLEWKVLEQGQRWVRARQVSGGWSRGKVEVAP